MNFVDLVREPAIHIRLPWPIGKSADGASFTLEAAGGGAFSIGPYVPKYEAANALLLTGAPLAELRDTVIAASDSFRAAAYMLWLQQLCGWSVVEFPLMDEKGERACVLPQWASFMPTLAPEAPEAQAQLDRFACLRRDGGAWLLESPLVGARLRFSDLAALDAPVVRRALDAAGFLETAPRDEPRGTALAQWEFHDLLCYTHQRDGWHRDPVGGMYPYIDQIEPSPAIRPPWPGERVKLARASDGGESFASVLGRRRSERFYDETRPISLDDLGALFDRVARIQSSATETVENYLGRTASVEFAPRPYPSGGGSWELEIYPIVDRCDGLDSGLYHYDAARHELVRITGRTPDVERFVKVAKISTANQADPQVVLAIAARFGRVMWKYKAISFGTILRNTGVLYQTLYLAATEMGLSPCGIGSGDSSLFARMTGLDPVIEGTVGEFILGGPPRSDVPGPP